jgi:glucan biosynthesis protein
VRGVLVLLCCLSGLYINEVQSQVDKTDCVTNCVSETRQGDSIVYTWKDKNGESVRAFVVQLPAGEMKKHSLSVLNTAASAGNTMTSEESLPGGKKAVTSVTTIAARGKMAIITIIKIYDRDGNLIDVKVIPSEMPIPIDDKLE